jgi:hypothetical protein
MICNIDATGVCAKCKRPERRKGFARMCCGSPGCSADTILAKFSEENYAAMTAHAHGPGTELKKLLATVGITASSTCSCNARAAEMNARGVDWCEANINIIVGWLRQEATKRRLPFLDAAGRLLVKRAIRNARRDAS